MQEKRVEMTQFYSKYYPILQYPCLSCSCTECTLTTEIQSGVQNTLTYILISEKNNQLKNTFLLCTCVCVCCVCVCVCV